MSSLNASLPTQARSAARWRLVGLLLAVVAAAHFNRISISVAGAGAIIEDEGVTKTQMGLVYSAYLFFYTISMSPGAPLAKVR